MIDSDRYQVATDAVRTAVLLTYHIGVYPVPAGRDFGVSPADLGPSARENADRLSHLADQLCAARRGGIILAERRDTEDWPMVSASTDHLASVMLSVEHLARSLDGFVDLANLADVGYLAARTAGGAADLAARAARGCTTC